MRVYEYSAKLLKVVDGDTLDVAIDLGFDITHNVRVRLLEINAPEMGTPEGPKAKDYVCKWFAKQGEKFTLKTQKDKHDSFGRYLAWITSPEGNKLNDEMVAAGHATYKKY